MGGAKLNNSTEKPFGNFLRNINQWLLEAEKVTYDEAEKLTPEDIALSTENARKIHMEVWGKKVEPEPEPDLEQLFGKPTTADGDSE